MADVEQKDSVQDIEELFRKMETAPSPTDIAVGDVAFPGTEGVPLKMTISEISDAGWFPVYHTETRDLRIINKNMLPSVLRKTRGDGAPAFTMVKPSEPPKMGHTLCWLHPEHPKRKVADLLNLGPCNLQGGKAKSNIPNEGEAISHMQKKHKTEYARMTDYENRLLEEERREEERTFRKALMANLGGSQPTVQPSPPSTPAPRTLSEAPKRPRVKGNAFTCAHGCGKKIKNQKMHDRNSHS